MPPLSQELQNQTAVLAKAQQALTLNAVFLALTNPTLAQNAAQIALLTREVNGLIRLLALGQLSDVSDT